MRAIFSARDFNRLQVLHQKCEKIHTKMQVSPATPIISCDESSFPFETQLRKVCKSFECKFNQLDSCCRARLTLMELTATIPKRLNFPKRKEKCERFDWSTFCIIYFIYHSTTITAVITNKYAKFFSGRINVPFCL